MVEHCTLPTLTMIKVLFNVGMKCPIWVDTDSCANRPNNHIVIAPSSNNKTRKFRGDENYSLFSKLRVKLLCTESIGECQKQKLHAFSVRLLSFS